MADKDKIKRGNIPTPAKAVQFSSLEKLQQQAKGLISSKLRREKTKGCPRRSK